MKSHIQINQSILDRFSNMKEIYTEGHRSLVGYVEFFNLKDFTFGIEKVKDFGTKEDYYESDVEKDLLSTKIEGPFGNVCKKINKSFELSNFALTQKEKETIINYAFYSCRRSENGIDKVIDFFAKHGIRKTPSDVLRTELDLNKTFPYKTVSILVNESSEDFIIPFNCLIYVTLFGYKCCVLPISPRKAICLSTNSDTENTCLVTQISSTELINEINLACFDVEKRNMNLVVFKSKETIIKLCNLKHIKINYKECDA